jgi:hypothetical protein
MKVGEKWKDKTSGAIAAIEEIDGDYIAVRFDDGGIATRIQRDTFLTYWDPWRRKFDLQTQERVRELIRCNNVAIPPDILKQPFHVLSIYPITGAVGVISQHVQRQAEENARRRPWVIDIGTYHGGLDENQSERIRQACQEEGIPFWDKQWMSPSAYQVLHNPLAFHEQHREICEKFGTPVPAILDD